MPETTLNEMFLDVGRKVFEVALKENVRGRFLRITEEKDSRRNTVIVPAEALEDFLTVIIDMVAAEKKLAAARPDAPPAQPGA